jgi:hypothetical protein
LRTLAAVAPDAGHGGARAFECLVFDHLGYHGQYPLGDNFIRAGYGLFSLPTPWAWSNTLYWRKDMKSCSI